MTGVTDPPEKIHLNFREGDQIPYQQLIVCAILASPLSVGSCLLLKSFRGARHYCRADDACLAYCISASR